MMRSQEH